MLIKILFNTDGFLGGYIIPNSFEMLKADKITEKLIENTKKKSCDNILIAEMKKDDFPIFHAAIQGRDSIEILPENSKKFDVKFGNLKLKFGDSQSKKMVKTANEAHRETFRKNTHRLNPHEKMIKELYDA